MVPKLVPKQHILSKIAIIAHIRKQRRYAVQRSLQNVCSRLWPLPSGGRNFDSKHNDIYHKRVHKQNSLREATKAVKSLKYALFCADLGRRSAAMPRSECMNMNLRTISRAKEIAKGIRTQFCSEKQNLRDFYETSKMRVLQKNRNGAQDGAQDRFCKRNTLSQETLKQRIYAVCAVTSPLKRCDFQKTDFASFRDISPKPAERESKILYMIQLLCVRGFFCYL